MGEFDAEPEADGASPDPLAVGPLAGDAGRVLEELRPVVVGGLRVLPHVVGNVLLCHRSHIRRRKHSRRRILILNWL